VGGLAPRGGLDGVLRVGGGRMMMMGSEATGGDCIEEVSRVTSARPSACRLVDVAAPKQIVQPADAEPPIAIGLDHEPMLAVLVGVAVLFAQQIDEKLALLGMFLLESDRKPDLARLRIEIVHKQHPLAA